MSKLTSLPSIPGYFWLFNNSHATPLIVEAAWKQRKDAPSINGEADIVLKFFSGEFRRQLRTGEYLVGPIEPSFILGTTRYGKSNTLDPNAKSKIVEEADKQ